LPRSSRFRAALALSFAALLAGCGGKSVGKGAACLPEAARPWLASAEAPAAAASGGAVDVYVDGSGSMVGYLRGATADRRPLQDLLASLTLVTAEGASAPAATRYNLFGARIRPLDAARADLLVREDPYLCNGAAAAAGPCDNQESRLDVVLGRVAESPPASLAVVVTDLWLSTSEMSASGPMAVGAPVAQMLGQGRAVGVLGVRAPYRGPVYDLPGGGTYAGATARPLYVLLIGPVERVTAVRDGLAKAGVRGFETADARWSLFTTTPASGAAATATPFQLTGGALTARPVLPPSAGIAVQQLTLSAGAALQERVRPGPAGLSAASFDPATETAMRDGAVWQGPTRGATKVWRLKGDNPCAADAWTPLADYPDGWSEGAFTLAASEASARLPKGGTYLLSGTLTRAGLTTPNPANAWMREWSFNPSTEPAVLAGKPTFFPTLHLAETARILESSLDQAARARAVELAGFTAVVRVD
jgi:hypothetical protein